MQINKKILTMLVFFLIVVSLSSNLSSFVVQDDLPVFKTQQTPHTNWYMYGRNNSRHGYTNITTEPINNTVLWTVNVTGTSDQFQSACIVDGVVYFTGNNHTWPVGSGSPGYNKTFALRLTDGTEIWNTTTSSSYCTPVYDEELDYVYVQTGGKYGHSGVPNHVYQLVALYASDGTIVWATPTGGEDGCSGQGAIDYENNLIIFQTNNRIRGFYRNNGTIAWNISTTFSTTGLTYFNHSILGGIFVHTTHLDGAQCYYSNNGTLIWSNTSSKLNSWDSCPIVTTIDNQEVCLIATNIGGHYTCLNLSTGVGIWQYYDGTGYGCLAMAYYNETLYTAGSDGGTSAGRNRTYAINCTINNPPANRRIWWHNVTGQSYGIVITNEYVYQTVRSNSKNIVCLYRSNGTEKWNYTMGDGNDNSFGQPAIADGILVVPCDDWNLYAFGNLDEWNHTQLPFEIPQFISIDNGINRTTVYTTTPTFIWNNTVNTSRYHLQISNDSAFTDLVVNLSNINEINYPTEYDDAINVTFVLPSANALTIYNVYYCRVRSYVQI